MVSVKMDKRLKKELDILQTKIDFVKNCNLQELDERHREKVINSIMAANMIIDLILEKK